MSARDVLPNSKAAIQQRMRIGRLARTAPFLMVGARLVLALVAQGLVTVVFLLRRSPDPWSAAGPWWTVDGTLIDIGCLVLLSALTRREGISLVDLFGVERHKLGRDVLLGLGLTLIDVAAGALAGTLTTLALYGTPQPPRALMGGLPIWAVVYSVLIWPVIWGVAEEMTCQSYALPRIEALTGRACLAVLIVAVGFGLQHIALPAMADWRFMLWRFVPSLLLGLVHAALYLRIRRLLPFVIAHWAANAISVLTLAVLPLLQR
jgi:hypothetical protein